MLVARERVERYKLARQRRRGWLTRWLLIAVAVGLFAATLVLVPIADADGQELPAEVVPAAPVSCHVLYETNGGVYVDVGSSQGLKVGAIGWLLRGGEPWLEVEVTKVAPSSAYLRATSERGPVSGSEAGAETSEAGLAVTLVLGRLEFPEPPPAPPGTVSKTLRDPQGAAPEVPLLAPPDLGERAFTNAENVFQGRVALRGTFQATPGSDYSFSRTTLRVDGSLERIAATPWALEWDGRATYRSGDGLQDVSDFNRSDLDVYRFSLFRRFDGRSQLRIGRFQPLELPALGLVDGVQGEVDLTEHLRAGVVFGFTPRRVQLDPSLQEPVAAGYTTFQIGDDPTVHYNATLGVSFSWFDGEPDRLALIGDQRLRLGDLQVTSSAVADVGVGDLDPGDGGNETGSGADSIRLTQLFVTARYRIVSVLSVHAGADRFEIPNTSGERDRIRPRHVADEIYLRDGFWRYRAGVDLAMPWRLALTGDLSLTRAEQSEEAVRAAIGLTRTGLPLAPFGSLTLTAFNLSSEVAEGVGARLSGHLPLGAGRLVLQPSLAIRFLEHGAIGGVRFFEGGQSQLSAWDAALRAHWRAT
ncbi:MAG: hypothetical protein ACYTFT_15870, partial [Planctomycetota bacterium]